MHKLIGCLIAFFIFGVVSVKLNPKHKKDSFRSIASVKLVDPVVQKFKSKFQNQKLTKQNLNEYIVQNNLDKVSLNGKLNAVISEYDLKQSPETHYFIIDGHQEFSIDLPLDTSSELLGKNVSFEGFSHDKKMYGFVTQVPNKYERIKFPLTPIIRNREKMLILFFKFDSSPRTFLTMSEALAHANLGYKTAFDNMSDRKVQHQISVSGWHHLYRDEEAEQADGFGRCRITNEEIKDAILNDNLDATEFDNITIIANCSSYATIGGHAVLSKYDWLGIGKESTYVRMASKPSILQIAESEYVPGWASFTSILVHERGHNFGLRHSNALDCGANQFLQGCTHIEYGNKFDRMGGPDSTFTFNADQQRLAGWKNENTEFHHIKESGIYYLDRLTETNINRKIGAYLYLPGTNKKTMMFEYRQADKEDNRLAMWLFRNVDKGIHLYSVMNPSEQDKSPTIGNSFRYIDSNPTSLNWHEDTSYESMNSTYYDPITGATIFMEGVFGTKAKIRVEFKPEDQMCFKTPINKKVKNSFITRYEKIGAYLDDSVTSDAKRQITNLTYRKPIKIKKSHIVLIPGDNFRVQLESAIGDNILCPRSSLKGEWLNADQFFTWVVPVPPKPTNPGHDPDFGVGPIWGGKPQKTTPLLITFKKDYAYENYDKEYSPYPEMKVPEGYLNTNHELKFSYTDSATGEIIQKTIYLHIRSKHNAIIYLPVRMNKFKI